MTEVVGPIGLYSTGRDRRMHRRPPAIPREGMELQEGAGRRLHLLAQAQRTYELLPSMFSAHEHTVFQMAETLYESGVFIDQSLENPQNALHALMLADAFAAPSALMDRPWLEEIAPRAFDLAKDFGEVARAKRGESAVDRLVNRFTHESRSEEVRRMCSRRGPSFLLDHTRMVLDIDEKNEQPYAVAVVALNTEQLLAHFGGIGLMSPDVNNVPRIILPYDFHGQTVIHEYAHTQGSLVQGKVLYSGLDEAITEGVTRSPSSYAHARALLHVLSSKIPSLVPDLRKAYRGDQKAIIRAQKALVKKFGLRGLLAASTFSPITDDYEYQEGLPRAWQHLLPQNKALAVLEQRSGDSSLRSKYNEYLHPRPGLFGKRSIYPH